MSAPMLQAIMLAERVYQDRETGKHVVASMFNQITAREFPCEYAVPMHRSCVLTGVSEPLSIAMRFVAADDHVVMQSSAVTIRCNSRSRAVARVAGGRLVPAGGSGRRYAALLLSARPGLTRGSREDSHRDAVGASKKLSRRVPDRARLRPRRVASIARDGCHRRSCQACERRVERHGRFKLGGPSAQRRG
jgi:hypothetical protein